MKKAIALCRFIFLINFIVGFIIHPALHAENEIIINKLNPVEIISTHTDSTPTCEHKLPKKNIECQFNLHTLKQFVVSSSFNFGTYKKSLYTQKLPVNDFVKKSYFNSSFAKHGPPLIISI